MPVFGLMDGTGFYSVYSFSSIWQPGWYNRWLSPLVFASAFKAKWPVKLFVLLFCHALKTPHSGGAGASQASKHVDTDDDPYDITKGFFWAHMGWLMFKLKPEPPLDNVSDLRKDKLVMWQYKWVHLISFVVSFGVPALIGYLYAVSTGNLSPQAGALVGY